MRSFKTEGIIIKRKNYSEADRILTVLTKFHGKIQIKASGIRKIPSRRAYHVELLNHSFLSLYRGRIMPILTEVQTIESFSSVKENLQTIGSAFHLCELIDSLCPENQENPQVFDLLKDTLTKLSNPFPPLLKGGRGDLKTSPQATGPHQVAMIHDSTPNSSLIHNFELQLLSALGFWNKSEVLSQSLSPRDFIEDLLERKLKTYPIFAKL